MLTSDMSDLLQSSSELKRKLSLFVTPLLKVKHGGTNVIVDAIFIPIYYIQFDKCNMHAITISGVRGKRSRAITEGGGCVNAG
jgi:hypothetical protein